LATYLSFDKITETEGMDYTKLCVDEAKYLNSANIHDKIQDKLIKCICDEETEGRNLRVNYELAIRNVAEYNAMLLNKSEEDLKQEKELSESTNSILKTVVTSVLKVKTKEELDTLKETVKPILEDEKTIKNESTEESKKKEKKLNKSQQMGM
jgi:hypothetical protein